jgi:hypothetical protein
MHFILTNFGMVFFYISTRSCEHARSLGDHSARNSRLCQSLSTSYSVRIKILRREDSEYMKLGRHFPVEQVGLRLQWSDERIKPYSFILGTAGTVNLYSSQRGYQL